MADLVGMVIGNLEAGMGGCEGLLVVHGCGGEAEMIWFGGGLVMN